MKVMLKNNVFTATQWFKDGDHPAVEHCAIPKYTRDHYRLDSEHGDLGHDEYYYNVLPGDWIVEMFDGIHLYSDKDFRKLFVKKEVL